MLMIISEYDYEHTGLIGQKQMQSKNVTIDRILNAINQEEFQAYIQPIVHASDLTVSGGELLVRWHSSTGKVIPPSCFIGLVESAGLLPLMTKNILRQAAIGLSDMVHMLSQDFRLAVNVTPALLADRGFVQMCLRMAGESSMHLVLELTESHPFSLDRQTEQVMSELIEVGVEFALDDFGTGYSTLSYLKYFPVSYIKIDKVFINNIQQEEKSCHIIDCIVSLAGKIGCRTVAEGVETLEQFNCLFKLGIDYFQGYFFGKPKQITKNYSS